MGKQISPTLAQTFVELLHEHDGLKLLYAKYLWERDCGGGDFMAKKLNHAIAEGYELRYYKPYFPEEVR